MTAERSSLVVVANRLPVDHVVVDERSSWRTSPGGLVSALVPVLQQVGGVWIGWAGRPGVSEEPFQHDGILLRPIDLSEAEIDAHYEGFSNGTLWPLYHDLAAQPEFHRDWWQGYQAVNRRFAAIAAEAAAPGATVWVHDYQLQLVPQYLRELRPDLRIGFFLHIPFPPSELFSMLPWRAEILQGLLGADIVGFQVEEAARNFARLVRDRLGYKTNRDQVTLPDGRVVRARAYPISIDAQSLENLARTVEVERRVKELRESLGNPRRIFLGVDRLDYTKGIYQRIKAFGELLLDGTLSIEDVVFVQVAVPSRERVEQYRILRDELELLVGRLNGDLGRLGHPAIQYLHHSYSREEMAAFYRMADIMVVTPYRDGMNLVAKEYVACRYNEDGALVLSEFAGAAEELRQAWLVNPYDINAIKDALMEAYHAQPGEQQRRMKAMRNTITNNDVSSWAHTILVDLRD